MIVLSNVPLAPRTTLKIGGPARFFAEPGDTTDLTRALRHFGGRGVPVTVLGGGANVVVDDAGVSGAVIATARMRRVVASRDRIVAEAGVRLETLVARAIREGRSGFEALAGIPGSVGGAVRMNAGGRHGDTAAIVEEVVCVDMAGDVHVIQADGVGFGYRQSGLAGLVVAEIVFRTEMVDPVSLVGRCREILAAKKIAQPLGRTSAGCVFKNPPGLSAGRLIEAQGLKGLSIGGCQVSEVHANFIVNTGGGTAADYLALADELRSRVLADAGVALEMEVAVLGSGRAMAMRAA